MYYFLRLVLLSSFLIPATLVAGSLFDQLSYQDKQYWNKLLHANNNGVSLADGALFFLAPDGKKNAASELEATINSFKDTNAQSGWFHYHPQCVFRERYRFLKSVGLLNNTVEKSCPEFDEWKNGLNTESVTLIFSSSYPNNPSSLFGHTLIRLNQKNKTNDLLDYSIAFSAIPNNNDIGIIFAYKGMFGGYQGLLEVTKYYTKVNDYNNGESRDLIEYQLKMSPEQIDRLINHLWEIYQTTYFDYFFLDENCSSVLADILAVAFDQLQVNYHKRWYYLPAEMIKTFWNANLVESVNYRPSLKRKLEMQLLTFNKNEINAIKDLDYKQNLKIHDGVISYLDFLRYQTRNNLSINQKKILRSALISRSTLPQAEFIPQTFEQTNRPELGHEPRKISIYHRSTLLGLELKQGHHDLMSNDLGYDQFSQFDFLTLSIFYDTNKKKFTYDKFTFVDLVSLHPYSFYDPQFSWQATVAGDGDNSIYGKAFGGVSFKPYHPVVFSFLLGFAGYIDGQYRNNYRISPMMKFSFLSTITERAKIGFFDELSTYENSLMLQFSFFSSKNTEFRMIGKKKVIQFNYGYYF